MSAQREVLVDPIFNNNPIALQILGICFYFAQALNPVSKPILLKIPVLIKGFPNSTTKGNQHFFLLFKSLFKDLKSFFSIKISRNGKKPAFVNFI